VLNAWWPRAIARMRRRDGSRLRSIVDARGLRESAVPGAISTRKALPVHARA
jgi:hypothetical protein